MKNYPCRCQVCEKEHIIRASFLSAPRSWNDGRLKLSCGKHSAEEIRAAYSA